MHYSAGSGEATAITTADAAHRVAQAGAGAERARRGAPAAN
jgi:hypothetical protein